MVSLSMTLIDHFKVTIFLDIDYLRNDTRSFFEVEYLKTCVHANRKPYLTYGMVPCLVTLTDL